MPRFSPAAPSATSGSLFTAVVILTLLHVASEVLIPVALAILLTFLLAGPVRRLQLVGLPRVPTVLIVVLLLCGALSSLALVVATQIVDLAGKLPEYKTQIVTKIETLRQSGGITFGNAGQTLRELSAELSQEGPSKSATDSKAPVQSTRDSTSHASPPRPIAVRLVDSAAPPLSIIQSMIGPLMYPLGLVSVVLILVIFMLIEREDLRDRFLFLVGQGQLNVSTQALDDASQRVSRYLMIQSILNGGVGLIIGFGLHFIGIPNAPIWGLLTAMLRFIPYAGTFVSAAMPITLALATDAGWSHAAMTAGLFLSVELCVANLLEPWLFGNELGLSTVAILIAAVFWTWTWGSIGLILSTPLTVCIVVVGRYVPGLAFLNVLLGDEQVLAPEAQVYQRLLAMDQAEATDVVEEWLDGKSLCALYDQVLIPALSLAEEDRNNGDLTDERQSFIFRSIREIIADMEDRPPDEAALEVESKIEPITLPETSAGDPATAGEAGLPAGHALAVLDKPRAAPAGSVMCVGTRDTADEITSHMLVQLLQARKIIAHSLPGHVSAEEMADLVRKHRPTAVCICAVPPFAVMHARCLSKRLRRMFPRLRIVVGLWSGSSVSSKLHARLQTISIDKVVTSLAEALDTLAPMVEGENGIPTEAAGSIQKATS